MFNEERLTLGTIHWQCSGVVEQQRRHKLHSRCKARVNSHSWEVAALLSSTSNHQDRRALTIHLKGSNRVAIP